MSGKRNIRMEQKTYTFNLSRLGSVVDILAVNQPIRMVTKQTKQTIPHLMALMLFLTSSNLFKDPALFILIFSSSILTWTKMTKIRVITIRLTMDGIGWFSWIFKLDGMVDASDAGVVRA